MLACDIMLASENAYFVMPEIDVGLAGGARFLMEHFGRSQARAMYFTGRRMPAAELYRLGVIEACVPRDATDGRRRSASRARSRQKVQSAVRQRSSARSTRSRKCRCATPTASSRP